MSNTDNDIFDRLMQTVLERKQNRTGDSYTSQLLQGGAERICKKITEEAREVVDAAAESGEKSHAHQVHEAADLLYHLWVLLAHQGVELAEIKTELERRFGTSGLAEKAARKPAAKKTS